MDGHHGKKVAIVYASRHGSTEEIAEAVRNAPTDRGLDTQLSSVDDGADLSASDAVVLGSAVYMGRWLKPAREFAEARGGELATKPLWLLSSGPIGDPPEAAQEPLGVAELKSALRARDHRVFAGKIDRSNLGLTEKAVLIAVKAEEGDSRDWDDIRAWASAIADELNAAS